MVNLAPFSSSSHDEDIITMWPRNQYMRYAHFSNKNFQRVTLSLATPEGDIPSELKAHDFIVRVPGSMTVICSA